MMSQNWRTNRIRFPSLEICGSVASWNSKISDAVRRRGPVWPNVRQVRESVTARTKTILFMEPPARSAKLTVLDQVGAAWGRTRPACSHFALTISANCEKARGDACAPRRYSYIAVPQAVQPAADRLR